jgi:hypothetical protein
MRNPQDNTARLASSEELNRALGSKASTEEIQLLLDRGATPNQYTLNEALIHNHPTEIIQLLLDRGATPNQYTLNEALIHNHPTEIIQLLLDKDAKPNQVTLNRALIHNYPTEIIQLLLNRGVTFNQYTLNEALDYKNTIATIELLLDRGAIPNAFTLTYALNKNYSIETIELLLDRGAALNKDTLNNALRSNHPIATIELLLDRGAALNQSTLNEAQLYNRPTETIDLLLMHGAAELMAANHPNRQEMLNRHQELIELYNESSRKEITDAAIGLLEADIEAFRIREEAKFLNEKNQDNPEVKPIDVSNLPKMLNGCTDVMVVIASYLGNEHDTLTEHDRGQIAWDVLKEQKQAEEAKRLKEQKVEKRESPTSVMDGLDEERHSVTDPTAGIRQNISYQKDTKIQTDLYDKTDLYKTVSSDPKTKDKSAIRVDQENPFHQGKITSERITNQIVTNVQSAKDELIKKFQTKPEELNKFVPKVIEFDPAELNKFVLKVIEFAQANDGVGNAGKDKWDGFCKGENLPKNNLYSFENAKDFSFHYQQKAKESGIYTGREENLKQTGGKIGARLKRIPAEMNEQILESLEGKKSQTR